MYSDGWGSMPHLLASDSFRHVADAILRARAAKKQIIWGMGGHVIKCGSGSGLARPDAAWIRYGFRDEWLRRDSRFRNRDRGWTSEDVEAVLPDGRFGSAEETGAEDESGHL